jgi:hypothetical protein
MGSGFKVNQASKSEAQKLTTADNFNSGINPAAKKYLEHMNMGGSGKINKKRTESTAQARINDMMSSFKNNQVDKHAMTSNPLGNDNFMQMNG